MQNNPKIGCRNILDGSSTSYVDLENVVGFDMRESLVCVEEILL